MRVLVTGAGAGIGRAIAERFVASGATVHVCDVAEDALHDVARANPSLRATRADVGSARDVAQLFEDATGWMGGLDVLVNNCGIAGPRAFIEDITDEAWHQTLQVNLTGMFYCVRQATPLFKAQGGGCIINLSTTSARTGLPKRLAYVVSKAGVQGLTQNVARELGPWNVRCNAILPGMVDNPRGRRIVASVAADRGVSVAEMEAEFLQFVSMRTWVEPGEIGELAVFLASPGGRHISGQMIGVCGNTEWES
jgi:NAD(P)-dependent dehydrogenase (short-subunit alcohol dehydrogenase family)